MDMKFNNEYCIIKNIITGEPIVNEFFVSARVETGQQMIKVETLNDIPISDVPQIPEIGEQVEKNKLYSYSGQVIQCVQAHIRTHFEPELTPALFAFYRENSDTLEWIESEKVLIGWLRTFEGVRYEVIQAHQTQSDWTPPVTPTLWKLYDEGGSTEPEEWVQPGSTNPYMTGDQVLFNGDVYESLIDNNVWSPSAYPAGWKLI